MKILTILYTLAVFALPVFAQSEIETIKKANDLIANKKYESAFSLLHNYDPENNNSEIILLKVDIAMNYFVSSIMHQMFAFKDLDSNENIMDYRGKEGDYGMYAFAIDSVLNNLIKKEPGNCKLYRGLGEFYYIAYLMYAGKWLKEDSELFKLIETNNQKAIDGNCADFFTFHTMGFVVINQEKYKEAIPFFMKSIELNKDFGNSYYNLGIAYLHTDDIENAIKYTMLSIDIFNDFSSISDAARMLGHIYSDLNDDTNSVFYYEIADKYDSVNYNNIKPMLNIYVKTGNPKFLETTKRFFNMDPVNPTIYTDLQNIFFNNDKGDFLIDFYKEQLAAYKDNDNVTGNINFFLGNIFLGTDKKLSKEYYLKSKALFTKVYAPDHEVFKAIEDGLKQAEE
ncbi:MAG: Tetratricopeptide repeat protein [Ignavibacteria bacterium]|nr:Tetratricopeptide repeat protein [Ignavibacteria bacterium]